MGEVTIGLIHPGEMGVAFGKALRSNGHRVLWASSGRSDATRHRAKHAGLTSVASVREIANEAAVICSICPPHAAIEVAESVKGFGGVYLDANAISPTTTRHVGEVVVDGGATYVDGGIIGGPAAPKLCLSGQKAGEIVRYFEGSLVSCEIVSDEIGAASALKMAYGAWTKGAHTLLLSAHAVARAEGVEDALVATWAESSPELLDRSRRGGEQAVTKGWRWVGEMEEIAATFGAAGLPSGFHDAAGEIYRRSPHIDGAPISDDTLEKVLEALLAP